MVFRVDKTLQQRIAEKLVRAPSGCLEWVGVRTPDGYGRIRTGSHTEGNRRARIVTRVVWELHNGPIPKGMCVLHRCDNPPCCDLDHLFLGTQLENMQDKERKGRARYPGTPSKHNRKAGLVKDMQTMGFTQVEIARAVKCSQATVCRLAGM